jgi:hypothetical protein
MKDGVESRGLQRAVQRGRQPKGEHGEGDEAAEAEHGGEGADARRESQFGARLE